MSFLAAYIAPWNVGKYLGAGATAMKFVKAGGLVNMATSRGAESRRDYPQKGVDSSTALKMGAIEGIGGNFFSILILYMILSFWGKPFLKAIYTRIIDTMNKMLSKIDFIITSSIAWIIAWAIPLTYREVIYFEL
ncbi:hypothetical protein [Candidatus Liberibacter solanacearum]|nr:hypothetical protein [Candidatus Liberibacter solanacearum]